MIPEDRVVVTGIGVVCSIAMDLDTFAQALRSGCCGIQVAPQGVDGPPLGSVLPGFTMTDALSSRTLPALLLQTAKRAVRRSPLPIQVATVCALEAWERADLHEVPVPSERIGLIVAGNNLTGRYAESQHSTFKNDPSHLQATFSLHIQDTDHVGTLSEILSITGEGFTVGGASASGNLGIINGCRLVEMGAVDACMVVGALADLSAMESQGFLNIGAMACHSNHSGHATGCPFDQSHQGFMPGQGCASLVLESRSSATKRGAHILAEVGGYAIKLDGHRLAQPCEEGETTVMISAIRRAGLKPHQVTYVNAHGSGSVLGDETEVRALNRVFGRGLKTPWINSTKSLTGHCLGAAGVLEAAATVIQMQGQFVHPNVGLTQPIDSGLQFVRACAESTEIPFALSNSFGFGGINSSILLADPHALTATSPT